MQSRSTLIELGEAAPLRPFTRYNISIDACTAAGCTSSPTISAATLSQRPDGVAPPTVSNVTQTSMRLSWTPPLRPNGQVVRCASLPV